MTADGFFKELQRLILSQPKFPSVIINCETVEFGNEVYNCKNMYYCFDTYSTTDGVYLFDCFQCANCIDCDYAVECELCYESVDPFKCYNSNFLDYCDNVRDSSYCYACSNCTDVFGCVNLENKSFCIFNRQFTEAEYRQLVKKYNALPAEKILAQLEELKKKFPLTQTIGADNENTNFGNYIHFDKNCYLCFDAAHDEDCAYLYDSFYCKDSFDLTYTARETELAYQVVDSMGIFNSNFVMHGSRCVDSMYLFNCVNVKDSIGCVGLKNKQYCVLNRQLTEEEYEKVKTALMGVFLEADYNWKDLVY